MSMKVTLQLLLEVELFSLEEAAAAEQLAAQADSRLYVYKTSGQENWLEVGLSITDVCGIVVLPKGLPDVIDMPDDDADSEDE